MNIKTEHFSLSNDQNTHGFRVGAFETVPDHRYQRTIECHPPDWQLFLLIFASMWTLTSALSGKEIKLPIFSPTSLLLCHGHTYPLLPVFVIPKF
jgi:hypothetical protein